MYHSLRGPNGRFISNGLPSKKHSRKKKLPVHTNMNQKTQLVNHVALVIDESGSMGKISQRVTQLINDKVKQLKEEEAKTGQATYLTLIVFSDNAEVKCVNIPVSRFPYYNLYPRNMTALCNAICLAADTLAGCEHSNYYDTINVDLANLVLIYTDGYENNSSETNKRRIHNLLEQKQAEGNWTFSMMVPPGNKNYACEILGIPAGNVQEWDATNEGVEMLDSVTTTGLTNYYAARSLGQKSVKNFCKVDVDLSGVKTQDLRKLDNVAHKCRVFTVDRECQIADFVKQKTGEYLAGTSYYQLSKVEKLNPDRNILVMKKGETAIYEGAQARRLLGIPEGQYVKLSPYNLATYNVFCESRSQNRLLVRGTQVVVKGY